jgi:hypothetical protein
MKYILFFGVLLSIAFSGCEQNSCKKVVCTQEIASFFLQVNNISGTPGPIVIKVKEACNNRNWKTSYDTIGNGQYLIISDLDQSWFHGEREIKELNIFIYSNDQLITKLPYSVGLDCCHVYVKQGAKEITI